jgi:predicted Zn-dependent peptidase
VEEIKMYQDLPPRRIHDVLMGLLYGEQPAGSDVAGTPETVRAMTREDIVAYRKAHYVSRATAVVVSGNVSEKEAHDAVSGAFGAMPSDAKQGKLPVKEAQKKPMLALEFRKTDQVHLAFGIRSCALYLDDIPALRVATAILGGGMSSRLFQKMRDELGICYYVGASAENFTDHGFLEITAGVPLKRLDEALRAILAEVRRLKHDGVSGEELARVKEYLSGNLYLGLESSDSLAEFYGFQEIVRKPILRPDEVEQKVRSVNSADIARVCEKYLVDAHLNLALIGPVKERGKIQEILHI